MADENDKKQSQDAEEDVVFESSDDTEGLSAFGKDPEEQVKKLKEQLLACRKERQEYLDGWQRAQADFINARKREEEERGEFVRFSKKELIKELLPALDSFHTAFGNKEAWEKVDLNWRMGVQYIYSQLLGALQKHGITLIDPKPGEPFNPEKHASVGAVPVTEKEKDHTVVAVAQKGYALYDKVLEPARVKIGEYADKSESRNP